jgi:hypothetical protein
MALQHIYFVGINIQKGGEKGAEKTFRRCREIYQASGGPSFIVDDFVYTTGDWWDEEAVKRDNLGPLKQTITATLTREASRFGF